MNAGAKTLQYEQMHAIEVAFIRNALSAIGISLIIWLKGAFALFKTNYLRGQLTRSLFGNTSLIFAFWTVSLLPLADAVAIWFFVPIIVLILSGLFLKERIGPWRWGAVGVGFAAVSLIARPAIEMNNWFGIAVGMLSSLLIAIVSINLRHLGQKNEHPLTTTFYFLTTGTLFCGVLVPFVWTGALLNIALFWPVLLVAIAGLLSQIFKTEAFRHAEASLLTPFSYLSIFWAALIGWMFFGDVPDIYVVSGCSLLIFSNILILWRESKLMKKRS
jgi:drug/metabolite transporter (DMT)-like permease